MEVTYVAEMKLSYKGHVQTAQVLVYIVNSSDSAKNKVISARLTENKALPSLTIVRFTKYQYKVNISISSNTHEEHCPLHK